MVVVEAEGEVVEATVDTVMTLLNRFQGAARFASIGFGEGFDLFRLTGHEAFELLAGSYEDLGFVAR